MLGEKNSPSFTKHETGNGFEIAWLPYEEALNALVENEAIGNDGRDYIVPRDRAFLEAAGKMMI